MNYVIREMKKEDSKAVSHVITVGWNETYPGIVPDSFLKELIENEEGRAKRMYNTFDEKDDDVLVLEVDGEVVGFERFGKYREDDYQNAGEIYALYIIGKYKGSGYGKKLVNEAIKILKEKGYTSILIGCLDGNPSNEFYKHIGGKFVKTGTFKRLNLKENYYLLDNI